MYENSIGPLTPYWESFFWSNNEEIKYAATTYRFPEENLKVIRVLKLRPECFSLTKCIAAFLSNQVLKNCSSLTSSSYFI